MRACSGMGDEARPDDAEMVALRELAGEVVSAAGGLPVRRGYRPRLDPHEGLAVSPRELVARVKAILRRSEGGGRKTNATVLTVGDVEVDLGRAEARVGGHAVALTTREFALLQYLTENKGLALSRRQLLDGAWGADWYGDERTVDVHVRQLRKKLGDGFPLATVRGIGYRLE